MQNDTITTKVQLVIDSCDTLLRRAHRRCGQPKVGNQAGHVLQLHGSCALIDSPLECRYQRIGSKLLQNQRIPVIGLDHQVAIGLQVSGHPANGFLESNIRRQVITDSGQA